jgi:tetratricopeptide (TPR) repeat protein
MTNGVRDLPAAIGTELVALYNAGNWPRLVVAAHRVTRRYPKHALGWRALGKAFLQSRKLPEAIDTLSQLVRLVPGDADGYNDLGSALRDVGRVDEALASYRRSVALDPRSPVACSNLGLALRDVGRYEEAVAWCQRAIETDPGSAAAHNNLGNALRDLGRSAEAEASYRQSLALRPDYLDALVNLGSVLADLDRWEETKSVYRLAIQIHPDAGVAYDALGRSLSRLTEDDEEASRCLERAIALNAATTNTYVELGNVRMRQRRTDEALAMFRHAQSLQPLITWRANQEHAEFSALFLDTPMGGSTPMNYLAGRASYDRHFHCVIPDTPPDIELLRSRADVVFNMLSNPDDGADALRLALDLVERLDRPTINHPGLILNTDRETIARRFAAIPHCVSPNTVRVSGPELAAAAAVGEFAGFQPPLLVRVAGKHGGDDFEKFDDWAGVAGFVAGNPTVNHYLTEYIDYRSDDGWFRKYRIIFVDGELLPYHLAIHDDWKVHHFRTAMAEHAWMRLEEEQFLAAMDSVFSAAHQDSFRQMAQATGLDYGGIDCGLDREGRIVVFEANAAMLVHEEKSPLFGYKNQYVARIKQAFDAMLARRRLRAQ